MLTHDRKIHLIRNLILFLGASLIWIYFSKEFSTRVLYHIIDPTRLRIVLGYTYAVVIFIISLAILHYEFARSKNSTAEILQDKIELAAQVQIKNYQLNQAYEETIESLVMALEMRENSSGAHSRRLILSMQKMAELFGMNEEEQESARRGALLHDIGKIAVPDSILLKPEGLTTEERNIINAHPLFAETWLSNISYLRTAMDIPVYHHERWNGSGYPYGLSGESIPLSARIFAVLDVADAMSFDRPYREALPPEVVINFLTTNSGKLFDPEVIDIFIKNNLIDDLQHF